MKVYLGADHKGLEKKNHLLEFLAADNIKVHDMGAFSYVEGDDFNDPAIAVAKAVREDSGSFGILICGSAHGMTIQANRFKGIRAAHCENIDSAIMAREHDDANILCMPAQAMDEAAMEETAQKFLETDFTNLERRVRRINRLDEREDYD